MKRLLVIFVVLLVVCTVSSAAALEIGGVELPASTAVAGKSLNLNGAGLRTKLFFKIYAGGLYLAAKSHDAKAIINAEEPMLVRMHFIYDGVSAKKLQNGWKEGFELTAPDAGGGLKAGIVTFVAMFSDEAKENDVYTISWQPNHGTDVSKNGSLLGTIKGLDFKKALFAIWLGKEPVDDDLKEGMLGK